MPTIASISAFFTSCLGFEPGLGKKSTTAGLDASAFALLSAARKPKSPPNWRLAEGVTAWKAALRPGMSSTWVPLNSGGVLPSIAVESGARRDGDLLVHLADLALNQGVASVAVPVMTEPDPRAAAEHRSLVERLLGDELSVTGTSPCCGELSIKTRPRPERSRSISGVIDVIVEGEGGLRYVRTLSIHALPLCKPRQFAERMRAALVLGARYRSEPIKRDQGKSRQCGNPVEPVARVSASGAALIHELTAQSLGPCVAAVDRLRSGQSSRHAVEAAAAAVTSANRPALPPPPRDPRRDWRSPVTMPIGPELTAPAEPRPSSRIERG